MDASAGPQAAANVWVAHLMAFDVSAVWQGLTDDYRLAILQLGVCRLAETESPEDDISGLEVVADVAAGGVEHEKWEDFRPIVEGHFEELADLASSEPLVIGQFVRLIGPGLEQVNAYARADLVIDDNGVIIRAAENLRGFSLFMAESPTGWLVAGAGKGIWQPGWPPTLQSFDGPPDDHGL